MKSLLLVLTLTIPLAAQTANKALTGAISKTCGAAPMARIDSFFGSNPVVTDNEGNALAEGDTLADPIFVSSTEHLLPVFKSSYPNVRVVIAVTSSSVINAFASPTFSKDQNGTRVALVCIPNEFVRFMGEEDELAFMIAHELGHTADEACQQRTQITRANQVICEQRADEIGYGLARQAGYSPYAAAGAFGRIEMYFGDTSTGLTGLFRQLSTDHPITPSRIANMRRLLLAETHQ